LAVLAYHMPGPGGTEQVMVRTARLLSQRGWRFSALCPEGPLLRALAAEGVETHAWEVTGLRLSPRGVMLAGAVGTARVLEAFRVVAGASLVHAHSLKACLLCWPACRALRVPLLWHVHDFLPVRRGRGVLVRLARRAATAVAAVSGAVARELQMEGALTVPNGIEWHPAHDSERERSLVLYVGRVDSEKRPEDFVELAARLRGGYPGIRFVVAGEPSRGQERFAANLRERSRYRRLLDNGYLEFSGRVDDVDSLMGKAAVLIIPSQREPFGLVALEAMRAGVAVVGTSGGGLDEVVDDGVSGYLVAPGDVDGMKERVGGLLAERERCALMGQAGRRVFEERFRAEDFGRRMERVYLRLAGS
jgi:glycosyltransferase involved in cell wall biosynthesis